MSRLPEQRPVGTGLSIFYGRSVSKPGRPLPLRTLSVAVGGRALGCREVAE